MKSKKLILTGALWATSLMSHAAVVATFTGGDVGEGINFSGTVVHALNLGGDGTGAAAPDLSISGVTFRDTFANGELIVGVQPNFQAINSYGTKPNYGATTNDDNLEELMHDIAHGSNAPTIQFTGLAFNQLYSLQVLASDNGLSAGRRTSYQLISGLLSGGTVVDSVTDLSLTALQGNGVTTGVLVTLTGSSDALGRLAFRTPDGTAGSGIDPNGIASGLVLTAIPEPAAALLGSLGLLGLLRRRR
jgi:hypothetical protein